MASNLLSIASAASPVIGTILGYPTPTKEIEVKLALRTRQLTPAAAAPLNEVLSRTPHQRRYLTHAEVAAATGGYAEDVAAVEAYFRPFGIRIKSQSLVLGHVTLAGTVTDFERALGTRVAAFSAPSQRQFLSTTSGYQLPESLLGAVRLDQPKAPTERKESRLPVPPPQPPAEAFLAATAPLELGHSVPDFGRAYQFPAGATGEGQVIGIVELGGKLNQADLDTFFAGLGLPKPQIVEVGVEPPSTGDTELINNAEVALDIQLVGALAPQAKLVVYYGTTLLEALQAAVTDEVNKPTVLSVSWAGSEFKYSAEEVQATNALLYQAALLGITVVAASADFGALNGYSVPNVSLLASSPLVLGCGGTIATLTAVKLTDEVVWNELGGQVASGGGYSQLYPQPYYQAAAAALYPYQRAAARGVPDVAANASMSAASCYRVLVAGQTTPGGGTSAATPLVATLIALLNEKLGYRLGFVNPTLYSFAGSSAFRPITQGNNNLYAAAPIWNPCTGLGSLVGTELLAHFRHLEQAGQPAGSPATPVPAAAAADSPGPDTIIDIPHTVVDSPDTPAALDIPAAPDAPADPSPLPPGNRRRKAPGGPPDSAPDAPRPDEA